MKQNIQQLIIAATIILAAGNNWAVAQSNSTAISSSETISTSSPSPRLSLRSNLLLWAFGSPSLGMDLTLGRRWQVGLDGSYGNWTCATPTSTSSYSPPAPRDARATSYQPESSLDTPSHLTPAAAGPLTPHLPWDISTKTTTDTPGTPPPPKTGYSVPAPTTASH